MQKITILEISMADADQLSKIYADYVNQKSHVND